MVHARAHRFRRLAPLVIALVLLGGSGAASAQRMPALRTVRYHGYAVRIPRSWPVFDLSRDPRTCVRFDRHALYLGDPSSEQSCPAHAVGRTEAILVAPAAASAARSAQTPARAVLADGAATTFEVPAAGVLVTATWSHDRKTVQQALHRSSLPAPRSVRSVAPEPGARAAAVPHSQPHQAGEVYTGLGFDACSAPSTQTMSAWQSSPYRAIGVYVGGINAACSQPNLSASWVGTEVAAGWHLILTYVGLQAPSNSCGCAGITPSQASTEGTAAADDAVGDAQSLGIPAGNPIYDDMENYSRGATNSSAVLAYLSAWTSELHAEGYLSGVYSNADSGITDLVNANDTGYVEPDDIWIADWNGEQSTSDAYVPASDWANHQRLHQYRGGHNETYGGDTINIDGDYLDGATATNTTGTPPPPPPPTLAVSPTSTGATSLTAKWSAGAGLASWLALAGSSAGALTPVGRTTAHGTAAQLTLRTAAPYFAVQALGSSGQVLANSSTVATPSFLALYGRSAFVSQSTGVGGLPAGCYTAAACHVATTITVGRTTVARTGTELIPQDGTGILYFKLTPQGRGLLAHARGARLGVLVSARDSSGSTATASLTLIPFSTSGRGPRRSVSQSQAIRIVGYTDFVYARGAGGILAACTGVAPCSISARLTVGRTTIASTRPELVGGDELGYLIFSLTSGGRSMLTHASGNQLGMHLELSDGSSVASGSIALVQFS